jgi:hypothetical protein
MIKVTIEFNVGCCDNCPWGSTSRSYISESLNKYKRVFCGKLEKTIYDCLDLWEKAIIPEECPYNK